MSDVKDNLDMRLASGEISLEEYQKILATLEKHSGIEGKSQTSDKIVQKKQSQVAVEKKQEEKKQVKSKVKTSSPPQKQQKKTKPKRKLSSANKKRILISAVIALIIIAIIAGAMGVNSYLTRIRAEQLKIKQIAEAKLIAKAKRIAEEKRIVKAKRYLNTINGKNYVIPNFKMKLVYVAPGSFQMGSNNGESNEKPVHRVTLTKGYWIGKYEVTQSEYQYIMGMNPSEFKGYNKPVDKVSWNDTVIFCRKLNIRESAGNRLPYGYEYRLPTEAEWEFAARGGVKSRGYKYSGSNNIDEIAWYRLNSGNSTHDVGTKLPNELGINDMTGNTYEWCFDHVTGFRLITNTYRDGIVDPVCNKGNYRILRGGRWNYSAESCRVTNRFWQPFYHTSGYLGFRVVLARKLQ